MEPQTGQGFPATSPLASIPACPSRKRLLIAEYFMLSASYSSLASLYPDDAIIAALSCFSASFPSSERTPASSRSLDISLILTFHIESSSSAPESIALLALHSFSFSSKRSCPLLAFSSALSSALFFFSAFSSAFLARPSLENVSSAFLTRSSTLLKLLRSASQTFDASISACSFSSAASVSSGSFVICSDSDFFSTSSDFMAAS